MPIARWSKRSPRSQRGAACRARRSRSRGCCEERVTAPIIGATRLEQLDDAVAALSLELGADDIAELEAPYVPHPVIGHE